MRVFTNHALVRRNHNLGRALVFLGLGTLAAGFVISFTNPEAVIVVLAAAFVGTLVSQAGITFLNRWGRHPRPDEVINLALKGLDDRYSVFHYGLGTDHLVAGPSGTYTISTRNDEGEISYEDGHIWQVRPKRGIFRRGGRSELRHLETEATRQANSALSALGRWLGESDEMQVTPVTVFVSDAATVQIGPEVDHQVILHRSKLKDWLRRAGGGKKLTKSQVDEIADDLGLEAD
jgi:hypothetical protein